MTMNGQDLAESGVVEVLNGIRAALAHSHVLDSQYREVAAARALRNSELTREVQSVRTLNEQLRRQLEEARVEGERLQAAYESECDRARSAGEALDAVRRRLDSKRTKSQRLEARLRRAQQRDIRHRRRIARLERRLGSARAKNADVTSRRLVSLALRVSDRTRRIRRGLVRK